MIPLENAQAVFQAADFNDADSLIAAYRFIEISVLPPHQWGQDLKFIVMGLIAARLDAMGVEWDNPRRKIGAPPVLESRPREDIPIGEMGPPLGAPVPRTMSDADVPAVTAQPSPTQPTAVVPNTVPNHVIRTLQQRGEALPMGTLPFVDVQKEKPIPPGLAGNVPGPNGWEPPNGGQG